MPIVENADTTERLLGVGDEIETDDGVGVITNITLNAAEYNGEWQLEPPAIEVKLEDGSTVHTCICSLKVPGEEDATELLHQEYDRLWPPMQDEVPEDADVLIPEGDEDMRTANYPSQQLDVVIAERLEAGEPAVQIAKDLDLKTANNGTVVVLPGWYADGGEEVIFYEQANSGKEAAQKCVDECYWGEADEARWVRIYVWQEGITANAKYVIPDVIVNKDSYVFLPSFG